MSSRAVPSRDGSRVPSTARLLLGAALVLGLGATLVLVFSDDSRFLKLGIVAALWAALVGAFLAARLRRQVADSEDESSSMQAIYELELEREIAARREYELELEAEAKRKAEEQSRQDIDALRTELGALRETLQTLLGGEVLVERFALQAQATRMRSLPDEAHQLPPQNPMIKRLNPAPAAAAPPNQPVIIPGEPQTELMDRVSSHQPRRETRPQPQRPQQQRPARSPSERQVQVSQPMAQPRRDEDPGSGWWEPVVQPGAAAPRRQEYQSPVAGDSVNSLGEGIDMSWTPSWERGGPQPSAQMQAPRQQPGRPPRPPKKPEPQPSRPMQRPTEAETRVQTPVVKPQPPVEAPTQIQPLPEPIPARPPEPPARAEASMRGVAPVQPPSVRGMTPVQPPSVRGMTPVQPPSVRGMTPVQPPSMRGMTPVQPPSRAAEASMRGVAPVARPAETSMRGVAPVRPPEPPPPPPPVRKPESSRVVSPEPDKGGRRRADESSGGRRRAPETSAAQDTGGRRRRADDAPSWQETLQSNARHSGSHAKPTPPPAPSGSHAEGKSVNELLAAYGNAETPRRRRRRDD